MLQTLLSLAAPAGANGRLSILLFHRVHSQDDPLFPEDVDVKRFHRICRWLKDWFNVLPLDEAATLLTAGRLPARALSITFDDGYCDNYSVAAPVLESLGLTATFFIATAYLDGGCMWNDTVIEAIRRTSKRTLDLRDLLGTDLGSHELHSMADRRRAVDSILPRLKYMEQGTRAKLSEAILMTSGVSAPDDLMLTSEQVSQMSKMGMQIGAHTLSHPILSTLSAAQMEQEIVGSKSCLENIVNRPITLFAYPNGKPGRDYCASAVDIVKGAGYTAAVSTAWGVSQNGDDPFQLRRFTPWRRTRLGFGAQLLANIAKKPPTGALELARGARQT